MLFKQGGSSLHPPGALGRDWPPPTGLHTARPPPGCWVQASPSSACWAQLTLSFLQHLNSSPSISFGTNILPQGQLRPPMNLEEPPGDVAGLLSCQFPHHLFPSSSGLALGSCLHSLHLQRPAPKPLLMPPSVPQAMLSFPDSCHWNGAAAKVPMLQDITAVLAMVTRWIVMGKTVSRGGKAHIFVEEFSNYGPFLQSAVKITRVVYFGVF